MVAMTKTIARAYARENVLAFAICPGFTMTGMAGDYLESRGGDKLLADIPLGRVAAPEEIANAARYLALEAPASMTGAGGIPAWLREHGPRFDSVIACRHYVAREFLPLLHKHAPQAQLVFDSSALHYLRESRAADIAGVAARARTADRKSVV